MKLISLLRETSFCTRQYIFQILFMIQDQNNTKHTCSQSLQPTPLMVTIHFFVSLTCFEGEYFESLRPLADMHR